MDAATMVLIAQMLPVAIDAAKGLFELHDEWQGNPEARCEALKNLNEQSIAQHKEAMEKLKESQKEYEAEYQKRERDADSRLKVLREENRKKREMLNMEVKMQNQKHDDEVKAMGEAHFKRIQGMRKETKETKDRIEKEHHLQMEKMEEEFKKQRELAAEKMSLKLKEVDQKLATAEKEKNDIIAKREEELLVFLNVAKELNALHNKNIQKIKTLNQKFRVENMTLRREQNQTENKAILDDMEQSFKQLSAKLVSDNSRNVVREFQKITKHVVAVQTSLENIKNDCLPSHGGAPTIIPGRLDEDFRCITSGINGFKHCKNAFSQYIINTTNTDRNLLESCNDLINEMDEHMRAQDLSELCSQLPRTLGKDRFGPEDLRIIKFYAECSKSLHQKFWELCSHLDRQVQSIQVNHLPGAPEPMVQAISQ